MPRARKPESVTYKSPGEVLAYLEGSASSIEALLKLLPTLPDPISREQLELIYTGFLKRVQAHEAD